MNLSQLEHIIRASSAITNSYEIIVFGSQAILATVTNGPKELYFSEEADIFVDGKEELSTLIDGTIGELSPFHESFGYYAQGISSSVAILPEGWRQRLVKVQSAQTDLRIGYCLSVFDVAFSKIAAFREKDKNFVATLIRCGFVNCLELSVEIQMHPKIDEQKKSIIREWIKNNCTEPTQSLKP